MFSPWGNWLGLRAKDGYSQIQSNPIRKPDPICKRVETGKETCFPTRQQP